MKPSVSIKRIYSKPRTLSELAAYYEVDVRTFKKWMSCQVLNDIRPEVGRFYSIKQIKAIVSHLGDNDPIDDSAQ